VTMFEQNEARPDGGPDGLQSSTNPAASVTDVTEIRHPYHAAASEYFKRGWTDPIPMKGNPGKKKLPGVAGFTGYDGKPVGFQQLTEWAQGYLGERNIGLRLPAHVVGIDVDDYEGKHGGASWARACAELGEPPATYSTTSRGRGQPARIRLYRLPVGKTPYRGVEKAFNTQFGEDVEIIHRGWRHVMVYPSVHEGTGRRYEWYGPDGSLMERAAPALSELPELPEAWVRYLTEQSQRSASDDDLFDDAAGSAGWTPATAEAAMDRQLSLIRSMDQHSKVNSVLGGAAKLFGHFVGSGLIQYDKALLKLTEAVAANTWHSDEWNRSHGKEWTAASVIVDALSNGMSEPWPVADPENPHYYDTQAYWEHEATKDAAKAADDKLSKLRARLHSRSGLDLITPPTPLIKGVLDVGTVAFLSGKFGTYKTFVSVAWACSVATGQPWEGREVVTQGPVVYVAAEGVSGIKSRVRSWELAFNQGAQVPDDMLYVLEGRIRLNDHDEVKLFHQLIKPLNPALVIFDTLHACSPGAEENSSKDMGEVFDSLSGLRRALKCTVLANHHTGHAGERSRGSSAIEDDADTSWVIKLKDAEDRSPANQRTLVHRKVKDGALSEEVPIILMPMSETGSGYVLGGQLEGSGVSEWLVEEAILKALEAASAPRTTGRDRAKAITGIKASNDVYMGAMQRWKAGWTSANAD